MPKKASLDGRLFVLFIHLLALGGSKERIF